MRDLGPNQVLPPLLGELRDRIHLALGDQEGLTALLTGFGVRFARVLDEVLADDSYLADEVSVRSYRHALGFDKIILVSELPEFQVRLHIWAPGQAYDVEHVHNHRYSFVSTVLAGELGIEIHELRDGNEMTRLDEWLDPETLAWRTRPVGEVGTRTSLAATMTAGSSYVLDCEALHRVRVTPGVLTATLFIETATTRPSTTVLVPGAMPPETRERTPLGVAECREALRTLATALAG